jgi:Haem-degrading
MSCGRRYFRAAASSAPKRCGRRQRWSGLSDVGHYRRPRWSGLQESNPVNPAVAYVGSSATWGTAADNLMGQKIGGVNVFGGGLALYNGGLVGGLGVSGDTSCADHNIAWRVRAALGLNHVPSGVAPAGNDGIIYDVTGSHGNFESKSGFGHPLCGGTEQDVAKNIGAGG